VKAFLSGMGLTFHVPIKIKRWVSKLSVISNILYPHLMSVFLSASPKLMLNHYYHMLRENKKKQCNAY
jgi:hypothetical protein